MINGFEAAWWFFGGIFPVVIPDNMSSIVNEAENTAPRFNDTFLEYAQSTGLCHRRRPRPRPRPTSLAWNASCPTCGTTSSPARASSISPTAANVAETWCTETAGMRIHGTTQCRPAEVFRLEELPQAAGRFRAQPSTSHSGQSRRCTGTSTSRWTRRSTRVPHQLVGQPPEGRGGTRKTVKFYFRGELVKVHPRKAPVSARPTRRTSRPERRSTPRATSSTLKHLPRSHGAAIGALRRRRSWTRRCPGPRCARSTGSWAS